MVLTGKRFRFEPAVLPTMAAVAAISVFIALGVWQLNRAQDKRAMLVQYEARSRKPPAELSLPVADREAWRYRHVSATGHFEADRQFLLDNQVKRGRAGYHVLTPLRLASGGGSVLIDRGWVPMGAGREELPDVAVGNGQVTIEGIVYVPYERPYSLGGMATGETGWPLRVQFIDFERMAQRLRSPLADVVIRLDPRSPYGYRREWQLVPFGPDRHLGYAVQWFALAAALLVIYLVVNFRPVKKV